MPRKNYFYPRSPCGERRLARAALQTCQAISIHALLAESDLANRVRDAQNLDFYPRSPCGERPGYVRRDARAAIFLSTLSLRRATYRSYNLCSYDPRFLSTLSLRRATAKVHKTVGHFCAYETNFMGIASSC